MGNELCELWVIKLQRPSNDLVSKIWSTCKIFGNSDKTQRKSVKFFLKMFAEISKIAFLNKDRDFKIITLYNNI